MLPLTSFIHLIWLLAVLVLPARSSSSKTLFVCPSPSSYSYIRDTSHTQGILIRLEQPMRGLSSETFAHSCQVVPACVCLVHPFPLCKPLGACAQRVTLQGLPRSLDAPSSRVRASCRGRQSVMGDASCRRAEPSLLGSMFGSDMSVRRSASLGRGPLSMPLYPRQTHH